MMHSRSTKRANGSRRAFTMIELLVVITIIVILLLLVVGVGSRVISGQKVNATQGLLTTLDRALDEYMQQNNGTIPPYRQHDYFGVPGPDVRFIDEYFLVYPTTGGPGSAEHCMRPDAAVFLRQAMGFGQVQSIVSGIGTSFVRITTTPDGATDETSLNTASQWDRDTDVTPSIVDSWAEQDWQAPWLMIEEPTNASIPGSPRTLQQLVFYVHPDNKLAQALFGKCEAGRPYFMSAGPDQFYGIPYEQPQIIAHHGLKPGNTATETFQQAMKRAREDNIYSYPVNADFDVDAGLE